MIVERVYCRRAKAAHELARAERDARGALSVTYRAMLPGRDGITIKAVTLTPDILDGEVELTVEAACVCGDTYALDVAAPLRGKPFHRPTRYQPITGIAGASPDRKRRTTM